MPCDINIHFYIASVCVPAYEYTHINIYRPRFSGISCDRKCLTFEGKLAFCMLSKHGKRCRHWRTYFLAYTLSCKLHFILVWHQLEPGTTRCFKVMKGKALNTWQKAISMYLDQSWLVWFYMCNLFQLQKDPGLVKDKYLAKIYSVVCRFTLTLA